MLKLKTVEREGDTAFFLNEHGMVQAWMDWDAYEELLEVAKRQHSPPSPDPPCCVFQAGDRWVKMTLKEFTAPSVAAGHGGTRRA